MGTVDRVGLYNVFARELCGVLEAHGAALIDLERAPFPMHRQTIWRLKDSLDGTRPGFPTLAPVELELVIEHYRLSPAEVARLKAALLANWIGLKLASRVKPYKTMYVIEQVFELLVPILADRVTAPELVTLVQKASVDMIHMDNYEVERLFDPIAARYDYAMLALNMSHEFGQETDRVASAQQAHALFQEVLAELQALPLQLQQHDTWHFFATSAREGDEQAIAILQVSEDGAS